MGLIIDKFGPEKFYDGIAFDADIMRDIMQRPRFSQLFKQGDVFVLDRGFIGIKAELKAKGFTVCIPLFLREKQKQLDDLQANEAHKCTSVRYTVKNRNRDIKFNPYLARTVPTKSVPHLVEDTRFAAANINR